MASSAFNSRRVVLVLAALTASNAVLPARFASWPGSVAQPVVAVLSVPARPVYRMGAEFRAGAEVNIDRPDGDALLTDLQTALAEVDRLQQLNGRLRGELAQLGPMRSLLEEFGFADLAQVSARVTGRSGTEGNPMLMIGAGSLDGVAAGQTVVYRLGLVGRVAEGVGPVSSSIALVSGYTGTLAVRIVAPSSGQGADRVVLPGRQTLARVRVGDDGQTFITDEVPNDADVRVGDYVRLADELSYVEARGFLLGRVSAVRDLPENPTMLQQVTVTPTFDLNHLARVTVLVPQQE